MLKDRILEAMTAAGLRKLQFANRMGVTSGAVTQWLNGVTKNLKAATAARMEVVTGYRSEWLITGVGEKLVARPGGHQTSHDGDGVELSEVATYIGQMFDDLPHDRRIRAEAYLKISQILAGRAEPTSETQTDQADLSPTARRHPA